MNDNKVPVLFLIFKRREETLKAFDPIKQYKPTRLYISADGPRVNVPNEKEECEATRKAILESIDWECEVKTSFRDQNLGCTGAVYGGITWFFEHEEWGIINEDDIVLSSDFFKMCEILLPIYEHEEQVYLISARNHSRKYKVSDEYVFALYSANIWGWVTWKRAWRQNPNAFEDWNSFSKMSLIRRFGIFQGLMTLFYYQLGRSKEVAFWDTIWTYIIYKHNGVCICPKVNLSSNVGIGGNDGTNYQKGDQDPYADLGVGQIEWPLKIQETIVLDKEQIEADKKDYFRVRMLGIKKKFKRIFK